jgi:hypothetical protein
MNDIVNLQVAELPIKEDIIVTSKIDSMANTHRHFFP